EEKSSSSAGSRLVKIDMPCMHRTHTSRQHVRSRHEGFPGTIQSFEWVASCRCVLRVPETTAETDRDTPPTQSSSVSCDAHKLSLVEIVVEAFLPTTPGTES
ncbi:unnamed protein product, partial [Ectocarpus fasciculatus]